LACFDDDKALADICSQSDAVRYVNGQFYSKEELFRGDYFKQSLADYKEYVRDIYSTFLESRPIQIQEDASVIQAIQKMAIANVSALAVVDSKGSLVGNFSATDLVGLHKETQTEFHLLLQPIKEFLKSHSPDSLKPKTVTLDTSLRDTIKTLSDLHLHRLWVVEGDKVKGVVSLTDVLRAIMLANQ